MTAIDHVMSVVHNISLAVDRVRGLGFQVTDRGVHTGRGTSNHLVMFPNCYWELLSIDEPSPANKAIQSALDRPGIFGCALSTRDMEADRYRVQSRGIPVDEAARLSRPVRCDGEEKEACFRTAALRPEERLDGYLFFCEHETPHLIWQKHWMDHPNGAYGIAGVDIVSANVEATAHFFSRLFDTKPLRVGDAVHIDLGSFTWKIMSVQTYKRRYFECRILEPRQSLGAFAGLRVRVHSLAKLGEFLANNAISAYCHDTGLFVVEPMLGESAIHFAE